MKINTVEFISPRDLFEDCQWLWREVIDNNADWVLGNNSYSLVTISSVLDEIDFVENMSNISAAQTIDIQRVRDILNKLDKNKVYIDLEG